MNFEEGINPKAVNEEKTDVKQAKAGADLFRSNTQKEYKVDTATLFGQAKEEKERKEEGRSLFENQVELTSTDQGVMNTQSDNAGSIAIVGFCIILVAVYIYYVVQKRCIKKTMKQGRESVMNIG